MQTPAFMIGKSHWIWTYCPSTGEEVVGSSWNDHFSTSEGDVTWWRCPACGGWHVFRTGDMKTQPGNPPKKEGRDSVIAECNNALASAGLKKMAVAETNSVPYLPLFLWYWQVNPSRKGS